MKYIILIFLMSFNFMAYPQEINQLILQSIKNKSKESHSDAVIIVHDRKEIYKYIKNKEKPIYLASAGKSLTSLAIGKLFDKGLLDSLDQPVHTIYSQWKQGNKKDITIRMLLNHTSGIQNHPNASVELEPPPEYKIDNIIDLALSAELDDLPGEKTVYNNKAVALLGGVIEEVSGQKFDAFFTKEFFEPMNILDFEWVRDKSGNPTVHGAFVIKPSDLLKFGELVLNDGVYNGNQIVSKEWVRESLKQGQDFIPIWGLLWWRLPEYEKRIIDDAIWNSWKNAGISDEFLAKIEKIKGVLFETKFEFYNEMRDILGDNWYQIVNKTLPKGTEVSKRIYSEKIVAYYADGYRGNYLVIVPEHNIIAVRCADAEGFNHRTDFFTDFVHLVSQLVK